MKVTVIFTATVEELKVAIARGHNRRYHENLTASAIICLLFIY